MDNPQYVISLCTGYGGIELGLELAGIHVVPVAYVEIEAFAIANLVDKIEEGKLAPAPICTDLKTFPYGKFRGKVHGITGGYPCQPFSAAGKRQGTDDPRHLWPHIAKGIRLCEPDWCLFENVEGHISLGLSTVISDLEEMGYSVSWGIFSAAEVGAPHQRKRVFILAHRIGQGPQGHARNEHRQTGQANGGGAEPTNLQERSTMPRNWPTIAAHEPRLGYQNRNNGMKGTQKSLTTITIEEDGRHDQEKTSTNGKSQGLCKQFATPRTPTGGAESAKRKQELGRIHSGGGDLASQVNAKLNPDWVCQLMGVPVGWVHPDGVRNRTDELRLLGNGVVPQAAAKAFSVLSKQLNEKSNQINNE